MIGPGTNDTAGDPAAAANSTYYSGGLLFPPYVRTLYVLLCVVILGVGIVGNLMVPLVILRTKDMRNSTNIFLVNLSVADLMVLLVCTPTVLVEVNSEPLIWVLGEEMCKAVPFVELTVAHASVLTILAISFERYYAICEPLRAGYVCTKTRALLICLFAWAFAALFTSPITVIAEYSMVNNNGQMVPACLTNSDSVWRRLFFYSIITIFFVLPLSVLIVLYSVIARHLIRDPGANSDTAGNNQRARKQVVLMLATVVLSFFLCLLPFRVFTFWVIVSPNDVVALGEQPYLNLLYFCRLMHYLNSAVNPILYNLMSSKFRHGFGRLVGLRRKRHLQRLLRHRATFSSTFSRSSTRFPRDSPDLSWRGASLDSRQRNGSIRRSVILKSSMLQKQLTEPPPLPESYV